MRCCDGVVSTQVGLRCDETLECDVRWEFALSAWEFFLALDHPACKGSCVPPCTAFDVGVVAETFGYGNAVVDN